MTEEWVVCLKDSRGFRHSVKVNADNQPDAIAQAKEQFTGAVIRRAKRLLNDDMEGDTGD